MAGAFPVMVNYTVDKIDLKIDVDSDMNETATDFLAARSGLSKSKVKDAMNKGAVWLKKKNGGMKRLRRATTSLKKGDRIELHYDKKILSVKSPSADCLSDLGDYSVWYKPPGLMAQGTMFGDHCSLIRHAELFFNPPREVFLVHRLDREASGVMLIAHSKQAAARLSELFQKNLITKRYHAEVLGGLGETGRKGTIEFPLDGKSATTEYQVLSYCPVRDTSTVAIVIRSGRLHQIRRHFGMIGHPVMGDPKYGKGNKNEEGMKLTAISLRFRCPFSKKEVEFSVPK
jgi:tRNA pseudouridine32 synthase/23S rRNA pseudouridine746 synthase